MGTDSSILGQTEDSPLGLSIALRKDPREKARLYAEQSRIHATQAKYKLAFADLDTAVELDPDRGYYYLYLRHLLHLKTGDLADALSDVLAAINTAPDEFNGYFRAAASVYLGLGRTEEAVAILDEGVRRYPTEARQYEDRAGVLEGIGQLAAALQDLSQAIRLHCETRRVRSARHVRARILVKLGRFDDALLDCNRCIEEDPKEWTHYRVRSEVYEAMGNAKAAQSDYAESMNLNSSVNR